MLRDCISSFIRHIVTLVLHFQFRKRNLYETHDSFLSFAKTQYMILNHGKATLSEINKSIVWSPQNSFSPATDHQCNRPHSKTWHVANKKFDGWIRRCSHWREKPEATHTYHNRSNGAERTVAVGI
jgi:hypothetical protein